MPAVISFTVETDGTLPSGQTLRAAMEEVDGATSNYPSYYMINCAQPTHFDHVLMGEESWLERVRGVRVNSSRRSHAELNDSPNLDAGDPVELGGQVEPLRARLPHQCAGWLLRYGSPSYRADGEGISDTRTIVRRNHRINRNAQKLRL